MGEGQREGVRKDTFLSPHRRVPPPGSSLSSPRCPWRQPSTVMREDSAGLGSRPGLVPSWKVRGWD